MDVENFESFKTFYSYLKDKLNCQQEIKDKSSDLEQLIFVYDRYSAAERDFVILF